MPVDEVGRRPYIELFSSLPEATMMAEQHRIEYNVYRPHSALQGRTPLEVLQQWKAALSTHQLS
ncbi:MULTISPECIES: integrase core domain-containing protein [Synechococcales]|uniref:integrase core domain-containing protein n=1 Tax=Synechococcus sp. CS-1324 TaxID=2847980 RepID=UPI0037DA3DEB